MHIGTSITQDWSGGSSVWKNSPVVRSLTGSTQEESKKWDEVVIHSATTGSLHVNALNRHASRAVADRKLENWICSMLDIQSGHNYLKESYSQLEQIRGWCGMWKWGAASATTSRSSLNTLATSRTSYKGNLLKPTKLWLFFLLNKTLLKSID